MENFFVVWQAHMYYVDDVDHDTEYIYQIQKNPIKKPS
jgi:hypothetical protein